MTPSGALKRPSGEDENPLHLALWTHAPTRMNDRRGAHGTGQARQARNLTIDTEAVSRYEVVFHQKFGYGHIIGIEGVKLTIDFDKAGEKRAVASYVTEAAGAAASAAEDVPF